MKIKRRVKVISETERTYSFAVKRKPVHFFCPACDAEAEMISINEAAKRSGTDWRKVVATIETGALHWVETANGEIYICAAALSNSEIENNEKQ